MIGRLVFRTEPCRLYSWRSFSLTLELSVDHTLRCDASVWSTPAGTLSIEITKNLRLQACDHFVLLTNYCANPKKKILLSQSKQLSHMLFRSFSAIQALHHPFRFAQHDIVLLVQVLRIQFANQNTNSNTFFWRL